MGDLMMGVWPLIQVILLIALADLLGGLFHWAEDTLGDEHTLVWGWIVRGNVEHHKHPAAMIRKAWFANNAPAFGGAAVIPLIAALIGRLTWQVVLVATMVAITQQVHRWVHMPRHSLPQPILWMQRCGVLQDARHHWRHHRVPSRSHYCALTPWMNPLLDGLGVWRGLERIAVPLFGAPRHPELSRK